VIGPEIVVVAAAAAAFASAPPDASRADILDFLRLASVDVAEADAAARRIAPRWRDGDAAMVLDLARLFPPPSVSRRAPGDDPATIAPRGRREDGVEVALADPDRKVRRDPGSPVRRRLVEFLEARTGLAYGHDLDAWRRWLWSRPPDPHPEYAAFKGGVLSRIDPRFAAFLPPGVRSDVRLDQVDWGGVRPDGIPPLVDPRVERAETARWLKDRHVVFGVVVDGEARAYPKRIVAWHEIVRDRIAGRDVVLAYCTLCAAAIPYESRVGDRAFTFGTSGLLYRSNKLMYDAETDSLWSALSGRPVIGALAGSGLSLPRFPVVTTTWGEWRAAHPDTTVVSIATGFDRDYREGAAYRDYFASPEPMFAVPGRDDRLAPKDEVLVVPDGGDGVAPFAIDLRALARDAVTEIARGDRRFVVVRSASGAARAYDAGDRDFRADRDGGVEDDRGRTWRVDEDALRPVGHDAAPRPRIPAHRAYWFGVAAQWPGIDLIR